MLLSQQRSSRRQRFGLRCNHRGAAASGEIVVMKITRELREYFDDVVDEAVENLPDEVRELLEQVPLYVEDLPPGKVLKEMEIDDPAELFGLYSANPVPMVHLFRLGLLTAASDASGAIDDEYLYEEVYTTILHEIGHHHGMNEDEVDELGLG